MLCKQLTTALYRSLRLLCIVRTSCPHHWRRIGALEFVIPWVQQQQVHYDVCCSHTKQEAVQRNQGMPKGECSVCSCSGWCGRAKQEDVQNVWKINLTTGTSCSVTPILQAFQSTRHNNIATQLLCLGIPFFNLRYSAEEDRRGFWPVQASSFACHVCSRRTMVL